MSLRFVTAGESHGPGLTAIVEGLPAGLELRPEDIDRDLARGEEVLASLGAPRPLGFRAPGYTLSPALLRVLVTRGYAYDASIFPAAPYWMAKALTLGWLRLRRRSSAAILDSPRVLLAPRAPYRPDVDRPERPGTAPLLELPMSVGRVGPQHALDQLRHHRQPERIGAPARLLHRVLEALLAEQHLRIMPGACTRVFVNAFLYQECAVLVDEIGQLLGAADRRTGTEKPDPEQLEKPQRSLRH